MAYSADQPSRRPDIEEGEIVSGYDSGSDTDDDSRYVFQLRDDDGEEGRPEIIKRRRLEDIVAGGRVALLPSPTSSCGSDGTISAGAAPVARASFPCPICRREFGSQKALHGHMRVHDPHGRQGQDKGKEKERPVTLGRSWVVTGKRGWIGGRAVFPDDEVDNSMVIVVAEPKLSVAEPMPMAFARINLSGVKIEHGSSSAQPNPNGSMAIVAAAGNPSNQVVAHPPAAPQVVAHQPPAPPLAGEQGHAAPPAGEKDHLEGFTCAECGRWFSTHQGLGGHVAAHKNRRREAAAAAAAAGVQQGDGEGGVACRGGDKPAKKHVCKVCGREFDTGVALGGHMRKHYAGPPIGQKKQNTTLRLYVGTPGEVLAPAFVEVPELTLALLVDEAAQPAVAPAIKVAQPAPAPAVEVAEPAPAPVAAGSVRIFGVNIVQTPAEQEVSAVTEDSASTSEQQEIDGDRLRK